MACSNFHSQSWLRDSLAATGALSRLAVCLSFLWAVGEIGAARAQSADQTAANNPLTPKITLNLHDDYVGDLSGEPNQDANQFLLRGLIPNRLGGAPQLLRFTLPIVTTPTGAGKETNIGDLSLMDLFPFRAGKLEFALGPMLVAPTAGATATGAGKWQAGAAGAVIAPQRWGLVGALITYQHSFAGDDSRPEVSLMGVQPLVIYNLPSGFYLRSTASWSFNFSGSGDYIPIGVGIGKVWSSRKVTVNAFVEPQFTVWKDGFGAPLWQVFAGLTLQFPLH